MIQMSYCNKRVLGQLSLMHVALAQRAARLQGLKKYNKLSIHNILYFISIEKNWPALHTLGLDCTPASTRTFNCAYIQTLTW
jgi:hypothetical protein